MTRNSNRLFARLGQCLGAFLLLFTVSGFAPYDFGIHKWEGTFKGFVDGRPALLKIDYVTSSSPRKNNITGHLVYPPYFNVWLEEINGPKWFGQAIGAHSDHGPKGHVWNKLVLRKVEGRDFWNGKAESVGTFYLHTWNADFISGYNIWNREPYGRLFVRDTRELSSCRGLSGCSETLKSGR